MHASKLSYRDMYREDTEQSANMQVFTLHVTSHNGTSQPRIRSVQSLLAPGSVRVHNRSTGSKRVCFTFDSDVNETARYSLWGCSLMSSALTGEILMLLEGPMLTTREGTTRWWWWSVARVVAGLGLLARRQPPPPPPPPPHGSGRPQHQPPPDRSTTAMADDNFYRRAGKQRGQNESSKSHVPAPHSHSHCHLELRPQATSQRHTVPNTTAPVYRTGFWTFEETTRMRIGTAPIFQAPPLRYCYWLCEDPSPAVINASDYRQLEMKRKWLLGRCLYHRS